MTYSLRWMMVFATVVVLFGCGSSLAKLTTETAKPTTASNKLAARRDAEKLLGLFVLPAGARRFRAQPRGDAGLLRAPGTSANAFDIVDRSRLWRMQRPFSEVVSFIRRHPPTGSHHLEAGSLGGPGIPNNKTLIFSFPAISGRIATRWLIVTLVALPDRTTGVRADAQDVWVVTRSPSERVPPGVGEIDITSDYPRMRPTVSLHVTDPAKVRQIVRWIDALGVAQPAAIACPMLGVGPIVRLEFGAANGALLAQASGLDFEGTSGPCNPIDFSIRGHRQPALNGGNFFARLQRLLGVRLNPPA